MEPLDHAEIVRIYLSETDKHDGRPTYEAIVRAAHAHGIAGATVLHGMLGYGAHQQIHTAKVLRLSENLPVIVEIIDTADTITAFWPTLTALVTEGLITRHPIAAFICRHPHP